jgi:toxin FitB
VSQAVDSSIALAALLGDHEAHDLAETVLRQCDVTIAHVMSETYSVLTRLPAPRRVDAASAAQIVKSRLHGRVITLDAKTHSVALGELAAARVSGGATYDGLIALAARAHGVELVSRDHRAARTYRALDTQFQLIA